MTVKWRYRNLGNWTCPDCGKVSYQSRRAAKALARRLYPEDTALAAYRCAAGGAGWHLGHPHGHERVAVPRRRRPIATRAAAAPDPEVPQPVWCDARGELGYPTASEAVTVDGDPTECPYGKHWHAARPDAVEPTVEIEDGADWVLPGWNASPARRDIGLRLLASFPTDTILTTAEAAELADTTEHEARAVLNKLCGRDLFFYGVRDGVSRWKMRPRGVELQAEMHVRKVVF